MEIKATQKFVRISPRKLRQVTPLVKDISPAKALEILPYVGKRAAGPLSKVIKTAIANARVKKISEADLVFKEIQINEGPRLKRWRAGARGRAKPYIRRMSHIRVVLESKEPKEKPRSGKQVRSPQRAKSVRDGKAGRKSLPALSKAKKGGRTQKDQRKSAKRSA